MKLEVNQFNLRTMGRAVVYQYQVAIQPEPKQQSFYATVFKSQEVLKQLDRFRHTWVHDGRQLAWSLNDLGKETLIIEVDMDKERGRAPRKNKDGSSATNKVKLLISQTSVIQFQTLERYLKGTMNWNDAVLECMSKIIKLKHSKFLLCVLILACLQTASTMSSAWDPHSEA